MCERAGKKFFPSDQWENMRKVLAGEGARGNPRATATNMTKFRGLNTDRGCFMISDIWHPHITDEQAFNPNFAAKYSAGLWRAKGGGNDGWSKWCAAIKMGVTKKPCA